MQGHGTGRPGGGCAGRGHDAPEEALREEGRRKGYEDGGPGHGKPKQIKKAFSSSCLSYRMPTSHQAILMRTTVIKEHKGFNLDYKILADFDLMQRSYLSGVTFQYVPVSVAEFKFDGVSSKVSKEDIDFYRIMKRNKSIKYPMMCFIVLEIKRLIGFVYRKFILRQL